MTAFEPLNLWATAGPLLMAMPRVVAAIAVAPLFPVSLFPRLVRSAIAVSLSLYLYPHMSATMPQESAFLLWAGLAAKEVCIGALLGIAVGSLIWAFECVGALLDFQAGFGNAQFFDPFGGHAAAPAGILMTRIGIILFLAAGGLQVFTSLLLESFHLWPVASFFPATANLAYLAGDSARSLMELTVRLAAPALLVLAIIDIGFGLVSRVVPQLNVFFFTLPIKGAITALMLALYLSYMSDIVVARVSDLQHWTERAAPMLAPH